MRVCITTKQGQVTAVLNDSLTAQAVAESLPLEFHANTWGDELYGSIPIQPPDEPGTLHVEAGDLAFWRPGSALCIFYGPTPASTDERPIPAGEVVPIGKIEGDGRVLKGAKAGIIQIEACEESV